MKLVTRKRYTAEFKTQAVELVEFADQDLDIQLMLAIFERLEDKTIIDIRAEKGEFLEAFLEKGATRAFSFEPYPAHIAHLQERFSKESRVRLFNFAVGERNETVKLRLAPDPSDATCDHRQTLAAFEQTSSSQMDPEVAVSCRSLDSLVGDGSIPSKVGILKTAAEGNGFAVIAGMGSLNADVVVIEFRGDLPDSNGKNTCCIADLDRLLRPRGFSNFAVAKRHDGLTALQVNEPKTRSGDSGSVIFIHDRVFAGVSTVIFDAAASAQNALIDKAIEYRDESERRLNALQASLPNSPNSPPILARIVGYGLQEIYFLQKNLVEFLLRKSWIQVGSLRQRKPRRMRVEKFPPPSHLESAWPSMAIVTPSFMQGRFLERTMQSVISQNYPRLSYIVQDGGSEDNSVEIIKAYESRLARWKSAPDGGQADAIKRGFQDRDEDIMAWLNSDDLLMPGALAFVGDYFAANPAVDAIYGHRVLIDENDDEVGRWALPEHDSEILNWVDYVPQETLFWRRTLWNKVGGIDTSFQFAMDWDLLVRFQQAGARMVRLPYFLGCFRVHPEQKTSSRMTNSIGDQEIARIRERVHMRAVNFAELSRRNTDFRIRAAKTTVLLSMGIRR